jgi:hypothetical protein
LIPSGITMPSSSRSEAANRNGLLKPCALT